MEREMNRALKVWLAILLSLRYSYTLKNITRAGPRRLCCLLPVVFLFLYLPLNLQSIHICGITAFFIAWLANFKLLLFAFGKGPLSFKPSISSTHFILVACLPIRIQQHPVSKNPRKGGKSPLNYLIKIFLWCVMLPLLGYRKKSHPGVLHVLYSLHIYLCLDIILAIAGSIAKAMLGLELEPQFDEPYLSCSLQEFWGRRWNLTVTSILRPTVYNPVRARSSPAVAVLLTFLVSGLFHELIFFYLGRTTPTWEVTCFFALHGVCVVAENIYRRHRNKRSQDVICPDDGLKKNLRLRRLAFGVMTVGFVLITASLLFFPQFLRCKADVRAFEEYAAIGLFFKSLARSL